MQRGIRLPVGSLGFSFEHLGAERISTINIVHASTTSTMTNNIKGFISPFYQTYENVLRSIEISNRGMKSKMQSRFHNIHFLCYFQCFQFVYLRRIALFHTYILIFHIQIYIYIYDILFLITKTQQTTE